MKKTCFLSIVLMITFLFTFTGCNNAKTDELSIDKTDINNRIKYNRITNFLNNEYLKDVFADDFESHYQKVVLPENEDEIKASLVEDNFIIECCKEKGIFVSRDSAKKYAKIEFDNLNKDVSQNKYSSSLKNALSKFGLSENEYLELLYKEAYYKYNRNALKEYFYENLYEESVELTLDEQFDEYIKILGK